jgi:hypothetical protein
MGQRLLRKLFGQLKADQSGSPARVLALQGQGGGLEGLGKAAFAGAAAIIVDLQAGGTLVAEAGPDLPDGAIPEAQGLGDGDQGPTLLVHLDNLLPHGEWDRTWHGLPPEKANETFGERIACSAGCGTTLQRAAVALLYVA